MIMYTTTILKFEQQGEKSGWTYITIPAELAEKLKPGFKKSFRVKGKLDDHPIEQTSLLPMGDGNFIMPLNGAMRKAIGKRKGAQLQVQLVEDMVPYQLNAEFLECLADEPRALDQFNSMPMSHRNYYSKWIDTAKTEPTRTKRIALAVTSLAHKIDFGEMLRSQKKNG